MLCGICAVQAVKRLDGKARKSVAYGAVPSAVGCVLTVLVCKGVNEGIVSFPAEVVLDVLIVVLVVAMRLISVFFDIQLPGALARHNTYLPSEAKYLKRPVIHPDRNDDDIKRK